MTLGRGHINRLRNHDTITGNLFGRLFDELGTEVSYAGYTPQPITLEPWPTDVDKSGNLTVTTQFAAPSTEISFKYLQIVDQAANPEEELHYIEVHPDGVTVPAGQPIVIAANGIEIDYSGEITAVAEGVKFTLHHELARPPHSFEVGAPVAYTLIAVNHGDTADTNVNVRMTYPNSLLEFTNASISPAFPITPGTLDFTFASILGNGAAGYVSVEFTAILAGTALTTHQFIGSDSGATAASATQTITIGDAVAGTLSIESRWSVVSPAGIYENDLRTIEMVVREIGNKPVTDATVQFQINGKGTLSNPQGHGGSPNVQPLIIELTGLTFAANEEKVITVDCVMDDTGAVTGTGRVTNWHNSGAQAFPIESNLNWTILNGLVSFVTYTAGAWSVNDQVPFRASITNLSNRALTNVQTLLSLPAELAYQSGSGDPSPDAFDASPGGTVRWDEATLAANTVQNYEANLTAVASGTSLVVSATGTGFQVGGVNPMAQSLNQVLITLGGVGALEIEVTMYEGESGPIVNGVDLELNGLLMAQVRITENFNAPVTNAEFNLSIPAANFQMLVANPETDEYSVQSAAPGSWDEGLAKMSWSGQNLSGLETKLYYVLLKAPILGTPSLVGTITAWDNKQGADPNDSFSINVVLTAIEGGWIY